MKSDTTLTVRDLVTVGILDAVFIAIYWTGGMTIGMVPVIWPFLTSINAVPTGVIIMLMLAKAPKRGVFAITGIVVSLVFLIAGSWWPMVAIFAVGGFVVDLVYSSGDMRRFGRMAASYALFTVVFTVAAYGPMMLWTKRYLEINDAAKYGLAEGYYDFALSILGGPSALILVATSVAGGVAGAYLGKVLLKKHFQKAGVA